MLEQFPDEARAALTRIVLEAAGVPVIVERSALHTYLVGAGAPMRILVPADRLEDARHALEVSRSKSGKEA